MERETFEAIVQHSRVGFR